MVCEQAKESDNHQTKSKELHLFGKLRTGMNLARGKSHIFKSTTMRSDCVFVSWTRRFVLAHVLLICCALSSVSATQTGSQQQEHKNRQLLHTTTNVLRQRPPSTATSTTFEKYFQNTYDPIASGNNSSNSNNSSSRFATMTTKNSLARDLPWGSINVVVVTDVHSWIAGGRHRDDPLHWPRDDYRQPMQDADYGDVLSFYKHLQELVAEHNQKIKNEESGINNNDKRDILFVMNGDFVDGTGLSGYPPTHLLPLLKHMPWDAINVGNHELYHDETIRYLVDEQQEHAAINSSTPALNRWNREGYLSSNTVLTRYPGEVPMTGNRYTYLDCQNTNATILAFGFLYDFHEGGTVSKNVRVEDVVTQDWFLRVLGGAPDHRDFDAILVLAHMDCLHPLIRTILDAIRNALPVAKRFSVPIRFVTGHTHRRCHAHLDDRAESFEAGRFLDTIGFFSFDVDGDEEKITTAVDSSSSNSNDNNNNNNNNTNTNGLKHRFLDANRESLHETLVLAREQQQRNGDGDASDFDTDFGTPEGRALTAAIQSTRSALGLDEVLGCAPTTYGIFETEKAVSPYDDSLWDLFLRKVLPENLLKPILLRQDKEIGEPILISGTWVLRYSLFEGPVTANDVIAVVPFDDHILEIVTTSTAVTASGGQQKPIAIYGWQLVGLLEAANRLYANNGEYGMPCFVLSTLLPPSSYTNNASSILNPAKIYRIFATDYDVARLFSVVKVLIKEEEEEEESSSATLPLSITEGRLYQSKPACRGDNDCYTLLQVWNQFIREQMPCSDDNDDSDQKHSGSKTTSSSPLIAEAQSALLYSRTTTHTAFTNHKDYDAVSNDQVAAIILVVVSFLLIAYLLTFPPLSTNFRKQKPSHIMNIDSGKSSPVSEVAVDVQLIPLFRYKSNKEDRERNVYGSV